MTTDNNYIELVKAVTRLEQAALTTQEKIGELTKLVRQEISGVDQRLTNLEVFKTEMTTAVSVFKWVAGLGGGAGAASLIAVLAGG